ncbi:ferrous iron transport protein A [Clostridium sp. 19966]|uniref:FeoA family protein n=1 Tax=Clostridium sp. 19966 TaxID=2768166 RepID=UPI0028DFF32E|nr:ferrous iron transport protein A [Clostridium sp. 19966]MDT8715183.1 ferrous iron transport protein A [Clostridium sp. 19966]
MNKIMGLDELEINSKAKVVSIATDSRIRRRIMDMGIVRGTEITVEGKAPLGDPIQISLRGYNLSLRKNEAKEVKVEVQV